MAVLVTEQDFYDLTRAYLDTAHAETVRHAEIFFDPQAHTARGVDLATVIGGITRALDDAERSHGMTSRLILCFLRHLSESEAEAALEAALPYRDRIAGVGLDSSERGNPPGKFARVFARARGLGLRAVAHAGEEGPAAYVREALDTLLVDRIDHGNRALDDAALVQRLAEARVPLTVCPLSNLRLAVIADIAEHPLRRMIDKGLLVTLNSDDPAYFGGYINANYRAVTDALGLSRAELVELAHNSFAASFLDDAAKAARHAEIDTYTAAR